MVIRIDRVLGVGLLGVALVAAAPARAADTEPGVWWEQTIKMDMPGMPMAMPPQVNKVCVAKGGPKEPPKADEGCTVSDVKVAGNKMTWKMECTKPEKMSGDGEMTNLKDSYTGVMNMHSKHGDMTMNLSAKKIGGDCDADAPRKQAVAMKKQVDDMQAQSNKAMAEMCEKATEEMNMRMFVPPLGMCKDPAQVAQICERLPTRAGYLAFRRAQQGDPELAKSAKTLCKKDPEEIHASLCGQAAKETKGEQTPKDTLRFLAGSCPDEARAFAVKECVGRSYSGDEGKDDPLRGICVQYAKDELAKTEQSKAAEEPKKAPKDKAVDSAKKALKGLFGK
jgi:hypothetical protein